MSVKSTMFLSLFLFENISSNSIINFSNFFKISYISNISWFDCCESDTNIFPVFLLNLSFTLSLTFFASSFISDSTFFLDHAVNFIFCAISYALFQLFKFSFNVDNCLMSDSIICLKISSSFSYSIPFTVSSSTAKSSVNSSSISSNNTFPQGVWLKSLSNSSLMLNISIFSFSHLSGYGLELI